MLRLQLGNCPACCSFTCLANVAAEALGSAAHCPIATPYCELFVSASESRKPHSGEPTHTLLECGLKERIDLSVLLLERNPVPRREDLQRDGASGCSEPLGEGLRLLKGNPFVVRAVHQQDRSPDRVDPVDRGPLSEGLP